MQQRVLLFDAKRGDQDVDGFSHRLAAPAQGPVVLGGVHRQRATRRLEDRELKNGAEKHQIVYRGYPLHFASQDKKVQFQSSPDTYWPMIDGACPIAMLEDEKRVEGSLEFAAVFRKRIWLFSSQKAMDEFLSDPADVAEEAIELAAALQR